MTPGGGAIVWARQTIDSDIFFWKPDKWFKIWFYIVCKVNHKDTRLFARGNNFFTYEEITKKTKSTTNQVKHCLEYLRKANMIATQRTTRGLIITVIKYDFFQTLDNYHNPKSQSKSHTKSQSKANQKPIKSPTINKNDKNEKNITSATKVAGFNKKLMIDPLEEIIDVETGELVEKKEKKDYATFKKDFYPWFLEKFEEWSGAPLKRPTADYFRWLKASKQYPKEELEYIVQWYCKTEKSKKFPDLASCLSEHSLALWEEEKRKNAESYKLMREKIYG